MASILVCYTTGEGQTAKIADHLVETLRSRGHDATAADIQSGVPDGLPAAFDAVLLGASIHVGKHQDAAVEFVRESADVFAELPTGFFQVSLSSASVDPERRAEAARYVDEFLEATGWHPDRVGCFGGALRYSKYGFLERLVMKRIAKEATGDTDSSRDYEYTDWTEVEAFATDFAAFVEQHLAAEPPTPAGGMGTED